jgi:hypothetical protein
LSIWQPEWYKDFERFLLRYGKWPLVIALGGMLAVNAYFLYEVAWRESHAVPAVIWATYMLMP